MYGYYYNKALRRLIIGFGSFFSNIYVEHEVESGNPLRIEVPLQYSSQEKFIQRLFNPSSIVDGTRIETQLPRMSFIMNNIVPDPSRRKGRLGPTQNLTPQGNNCGSTGSSIAFESPVNVGFNLFAYTRHIDDMLQITEQILPYFTPDRIISMELVEGQPDVNIPITLTSNNLTDRYDGDFNGRRLHIATFSFVAKSYVYGPVKNVQTISNTGITFGFFGLT